ncbi:site-2 protease family protein [Alkalibacter saccharofermentans]|uniref:Zinc metalloprotease n=1 Tax=Alkalibacter saccharofermentans DSM 14828 TaxID=1120975 RepID=A0A1M4YJV8_9FIRM|nr:site-2 protease family protein [Alkalibacter saccharofermentans]SHF06039.1 Zn-dependent protease (includes SpoIVFB) [Alkalibacter saccharofermentans DSM 14828]
MKGSIVIGKIKGISIEINISWLVIFALLTFMLATSYFPVNFPEWDAALNWMLAAIMTVMFFASVLLHELSHSLVSIKLGLEVKRITLFIFGGMAQIEKEVDDPVQELKIAIAGPAMSVALSALFFLTANVLTAAGAQEYFVVPFTYLATVNIILAIFNMVPAFPLDGGRVLRAIIWKVKGDMQKATKIASSLGSFFGYFLIFNGVFLALAGNLFNGVWFLFIGWFITQASQSSYQHVLMNDMFNKICVNKFMTENIVAVEYYVNLQQLVEEYYYKYKFSMFPVMRLDEVMGIVTIDEIKKVDRAIWDETTVGSISRKLTEDFVVSPRDTVSTAMEKVFKNGVGRVLVMEDGNMLGIVSRTDILNYIRINAQLDGKER